MAGSAERICNLALAKLGLEQRVASLASPSKPVERHLATIYPHYRDVELRRRRWVFAKFTFVLTAETQPSANPEWPHRYVWPGELLMPWPDIDTRWLWTAQGNEFWSVQPGTLTIVGTKRVLESHFDPLFDDVLAVRLANELKDYPGVTVDKRREVSDWYHESVAVAGNANAFLRGPEDIAEDDSLFSWIGDRYR